MDNCIGECYQKGEKALHPLTLEVLYNQLDNVYCPSQPNVDEYKMVNDFVLCTKKNTPQFKEIAKIMYTPEIKLNLESFLYLFNITSFTSAIIWTKINFEQNTPIFTILRNLNVSWKLYHNSIKKITEDMVNCYIEIYERYLKIKKIKDNKLKKKIIKKALQRFLKKTDTWDKLDFNSLDIIKNNIIKYIKKYK